MSSRLTKQDFNAIASIMDRAFERDRRLRETGITGSALSARVALGVVAKELADYLEGTNAQFNRARFINACRGR